MELLESRYAPKDWERYLHRMYYGKVYYWYEGLLVQPVEFEDYLLEPDWWTGKRYRSKRFVTPAVLPQRSMLTWCRAGEAPGAMFHGRSSGANRGMKAGEMACEWFVRPLEVGRANVTLRELRRRVTFAHRNNLVTHESP